MAAEVGALGQILPDESIGVFIAAALPRAVRVGEVDFDAGIFYSKLFGNFKQVRRCCIISQFCSVLVTAPPRRKTFQFALLSILNRRRAGYVIVI